MQVEPNPGSRVDRARFQRLQPECDETVSNLAFNFNLRPYVKVRPGHNLAVNAHLAARLCHVGTAFFDGVQSAPVRARLSELFAGGLPLVGLALRTALTTLGYCVNMGFHSGRM